jgi:serine/threonine-protein phosphatase 6 regulatory subunit 3
MFWRFGFNNSTLDALLDKEDVTLEEVMEEEDLLQEAKSCNNKLVQLYIYKKNKTKNAFKRQRKKTNLYFIA